MDARVSQIKKVLDELARVENSDNDTKEEVYDRELERIRSLDRDGILDAVRRSIGANKRRQRYAPFVFAELHDVPGVEAVFSDLLKNADSTGRSSIIQTIGLRKMHRLVSVLNEHFVHESDDFCRDCLLHALAVLKDKSSLPIFEYLMRKSDARDQWRLLVAGSNYGAPEFRDYLTRIFEEPLTSKSFKVVAAWGLGKLGDQPAYEYLVSMLRDPDVQTATTSNPGESIRAAQALADINGWDFEWGKESVDAIRRRLAVKEN